MVNAYIFMADEAITDDGFFFEKNTFIYGQNIKTYNSIAFLQQQTKGQINLSNSIITSTFLLTWCKKKILYLEYIFLRHTDANYIIPLYSRFLHLC